jgi:aminoglycoside phosphotransferase (APT) family kinase protein
MAALRNTDVPVPEMLHLCTDRDVIGTEFYTLGIPTEQEFLDLCCQFSGRSEITNHLFFVVFSLFRSAAIIQGVYKHRIFRC